MHSENRSSIEAKTPRESVTLSPSAEKHELNPRNALNGKENGELSSHPLVGDSSLTCLDETASPRNLKTSKEIKNGGLTSKLSMENQEELNLVERENKNLEKNLLQRNTSSKKGPSNDKREKGIKTKVFDLQLLEHLIR